MKPLHEIILEGEKVYKGYNVLFLRIYAYVFGKTMAEVESEIDHGVDLQFNFKNLLELYRSGKMAKVDIDKQDPK